MRKLILICIPLLVLLLACGADGSDKKPVKKKKVEKKEASSEVANASVSKLNGKKLFNANCSVCHMPNGLGVKGSFPPLSETEWVNGDIDRLVGIVLNGLSEEIEVNGDKYVTPMVGLPHLKDDEIAAILTYVRSSFGNESSAVTEDQVAAVRAKGK